MEQHNVNTGHTKPLPYEYRLIDTDILIIGGGTAGCYAAIRLGEMPEAEHLRIAVAEKADIRRSGCLAAGVNALNAYITEGHTPGDYVDYAAKDAEGIVRTDLLQSLCERLNEVAHDLERRGLTILKDENGNYVSRGWRNLKINGENIKPLLAEGVRSRKNVTVYGHVNLTDLRLVPEAEAEASREGAAGDAQGGAGNLRAAGAYGFSVTEPVFYEFRARAVLIATGGASGLYRPNNPGAGAHQMWYCPFNTGAGYAMGLLAGAEMTTFEMRFIALRCKDTIAPTGTLAQGVSAKQVNARGEIYENIYGLTTPQRLWGTVEENRAGRGPCYLKTEGISPEQEKELYKAYLNMAPLQTLRWITRGAGPSSENVEIEGTEPYVVGGHTASGYWVDTSRRTTLPGLYAAGDVAGGAPQKYVTGALAEGVIAAEAMLADLAGDNKEEPGDAPLPAPFSEYASHLALGASLSASSVSPESGTTEPPLTAASLESAMQKVMDEYAGGIRTDYRYSEAGLAAAKRGIEELEALLPKVPARSPRELLAVYELRERLIVCKALIAHLSARKETRWHGFQENADYPERDARFDCYVNSRMDPATGEVQTFRRKLVSTAVYEHGEAPIEDLYTGFPARQKEASTL